MAEIKRRKRMIGQSGMQHPSTPPSPSPFDGYNQVQCFRCDWVITVAPREMKFSCPRCRLSQMLPPEPMPPPSPEPEPEPESKPILPPLPATIAAKGVSPTKIQLPCALCKVLLNLPDGLERFSCPQCGVHLGVDLSEPQESMRTFFAYVMQSTVKDRCSKGPMSSINQLQQAQSGSSQLQGQLASGPSLDQREQPHIGSFDKQKSGGPCKRCDNVSNLPDGSIGKRQRGRSSTQGDELSGSSQPQLQPSQSSPAQPQQQSSLSSPNQSQPQLSQNQESSLSSSSSSQHSQQLDNHNSVMMQVHQEHPNSIGLYKRKGRGRTTMENIMKRKSKGIKYTIEYNTKGQEIGDHAATYASFICCTVRNMVPITVDNWRHVSSTVKDSIWETVKSVFDVSDDKKKRALQGGGESWRKWKNYLTRKYIYPFVNDPSRLYKVPDIYIDIIDQDVWNKFVESRLSHEFKAKSTKGEKVRTINHMQHHLSRLGYARLEEQEQKKSGTKNPINRAILWKIAHSEKHNAQTYKNKVAAEAASQIEKLTQASTSMGSLGSTTVEDDILYRALGNKKDHPSRVRGQGRGVTSSKYFSQKNNDKHEFDKKEMYENIKAEVTKSIENEMYEKLKQDLMKEFQVMRGHSQELTSTTPKP